MTIFEATAPAATPFSYAVGDVTVTVIDDGFRYLPVTDGYAVNASSAQVNAVLAEAGLEQGRVRNTFAPILVTTAGRRVLFDAGNGEAAFAESNGERGRLISQLSGAGIAPRDIDVVVISHFHADHVNGLLTADNKPAFPNAEIKVPSVEWNFWMDDGEMSRAPKGRMRELFANNRRVFDALQRKVTPYDWGKEVAPGVTAVETAGHSIGHTSFLIASGSQTLFVQVDVTNVPYIFVRHPDFHPAFDQDPVRAESTRRRIYDMLAAERMMVQAYHHPFPGRGWIEKLSDGYRLIPVN